MTLLAPWECERTLNSVIVAATLALIFVISSATLDRSAFAAQPIVLKSGQIKIAYIPPTNPEHQAIYELVQERHVLERMRDQAGRIGTATLTRYAEVMHAGLGEMRGATAPTSGSAAA
jgi:hypothetical protein